MRDRVNAARKSTYNDDSAHSEIAPRPLRHLRTIKRRLSRADNTQARRIEDLRVAARTEHHRRIVNLQQGLGILRLRPIDDACRGNLSKIRQVLFRAFE